MSTGVITLKGQTQARYKCGYCKKLATEVKR